MSTGSKSMGLSLSSAINLFLRQSVIQKKLPIAEGVSPAVAALLLDFEETKKSIEDGTAAVYQTPEDLFAEWENEDGKI